MITGYIIGILGALVAALSGWVAIATGRNKTLKSERDAQQQRADSVESTLNDSTELDKALTDLWGTQNEQLKREHDYFNLKPRERTHVFPTSVDSDD